MWLNIHHRHLSPNKRVPKYYCQHCGHKTQQSYWDGLFNYRCPKCGAATQPKKW